MDDLTFLICFVSEFYCAYSGKKRWAPFGSKFGLNDLITGHAKDQTLLYVKFNTQESAMKKSTLAIFLFCIELVAIVGVSAQKRISENEVLPMIAVQDDCPLRVERFAVVADSDNKFVMVYSVKNISPKNVVSYRILRTYDTGTGFLEFGAMPSTKVLRPGRTFGTMDQLKIRDEKPALTGELKALAFIMVVEVTFEDGTTFSAKNLLDAFDDRLKKYGVQ